MAARRLCDRVETSHWTVGIALAIWGILSPAVRGRQHDCPAWPVDADKVRLLPTGFWSRVDRKALAREGAVESLDQPEPGGWVARPGQPQPVEHWEMVVANEQCVAIPVAP